MIASWMITTENRNQTYNRNGGKVRKYTSDINGPRKASEKIGKRQKPMNDRLIDEIHPPKDHKCT